jgi:hypothetical protein
MPTFLKQTLFGLLHGAVICATVFYFSDRYTLAKDWFLAVMILFASTSGAIIAARHDVNQAGVAVAGLVGMIVGGWLGSNLIGSYEYTVPIPEKEREIKILIPGKEAKVLEMKGMPKEQIKYVPIGGGLGILVGWLAGATACAMYFSNRDEPEPDEASEPPSEYTHE